tara:strand:+ start:21583 stop:22254 length:672 start_codon:yes stop_codon:yes gene_type:complete
MKPFYKLPVIAIALSALAACSNTPENIHPDYASAEPIRYLPANSGTPTGSIYMDASNVSLFADTRARQVGDILTVILSESTNAAKSSDTNLDKETSTEVSNTVFAGELEEDLDFNLGTGSSFAGESASNQQNRMQGTIAVTVAEILPNGNFYVQGEKWIQINQGNEYIRLRGIIRPVDISTTNSILSTQVADARISYSGTGATAEVNQVGWLSRFFMSPIWPF